MKTTENYYINSRPEIVECVPKNTRNILDVGCGKGEFLKAVKQKIGAETWGIEIMPLNNEENIFIDNFICGNVEEKINSLPNNYFDCICFNDLLEHLIEPQKLLKKIYPKLKKDGIILASLPNVRYLYNLYELLIKKDWQYKEDGILDSTHLRFFTKKSMNRLFEDSGYEVISQSGINRVDTLKIRLFNLITFGIHSDVQFLQYLLSVRKKGE